MKYLSMVLLFLIVATLFTFSISVAYRTGYKNGEQDFLNAIERDLKIETKVLDNSISDYSKINRADYPVYFHIINLKPALDEIQN